MQRNQQVAVVGALLTIGVVAALPFARDPVSPETTSPTGNSGFSRRDIPLQLQVQSGTSPAAGLNDNEPGEVNQPSVVAPTIQRDRLEGQGLPPELPEAYHSLLTSPLPEGSGARRLSEPPAQPRADLSLAEPQARNVSLSQPQNEHKAAPRERRHRIVDGDTLARLAERYWGDAQLAAALYAANRDVLSSPDPLPLGVVVTIPVAPSQAKTMVTVEPSLELSAPVRQPNPESVDHLPLAPIPAGALEQSKP